MNLVQKSVSLGGNLSPLVIPDGFYRTVGYMNPSVFVDDDGEILVNLRHVNYTLYHSENNQRFNSRWGPLTYLHPETDQALRTVNYLCRLNSDLHMTDYTLVDTSTLDVPPLWEFSGEEDCRLVKWDGRYYLIGVRRDTTPNGEGRMELSNIDLDKNAWTAKEVSRLRIPAPDPNQSYCEKNWVPVLDRPYHFVKWSCPTELVRTYPTLPARCEQVALRPTFLPSADQRGGSQVVRWNNLYLSVSHEVSLFSNYLGQKDGIYRHRLLVWDDQFNLVGMSPEPFSFLEGRIEFCAGAAIYNGDLILTFGFQDNCAFALRVPSQLVDTMISEALTYEQQ